MCISAVTQLGLKPYLYQCSAHDARMQYDGCRKHFWSKDVHIPERVVPMSKKHSIVLIDVDYYLDMESFFFKSSNPIYAYTFVPSTAGADRRLTGDGEYSYCFTHTGEVQYSVTGASYRHPVWNYSTDSLLVAKWDFSQLHRGRIAFRAKAIHVDMRSMGVDHAIVSFITSAEWENDWRWLLWWALPHVASLVRVLLYVPAVACGYELISATDLSTLLHRCADSISLCCSGKPLVVSGQRLTRLNPRRS